MSKWLIFALAAIAVFFVIYQSQGDGVSDTSIDIGSDDEDGLMSNSTAPFSSVSALAQAWAQAIAPAENVNTDYNNPGGLNISPTSSLYTKLAGIIGTTPAAEGGGNVITIFDTLANGYNALAAILTGYVNNYGGLTILQATARYITGSAGNGDPSSYTANVVNEANIVASNLGADVNATLSSLVGK